MRVTVTGAAGYLGRNLVDLLVRGGNEVVACEHRPAQTEAVEGCRWETVDVLDTQRMREVLAGSEVVFHLAARITLADEDPVAWRLNTEGVASVAQAASEVGVRRMVHCSSVHAFDTTRGTVVDETSPRAGDGLPVYDRSKYAGELRLAEWIDRGLDAVVVNPSGVFGPVDDLAHLSRMNGILRNAWRGKVPVDMAGGFDWVDVRDVADGTLRAAVDGVRGENYLLGGEYLSMHDAISAAAGHGGARRPLFTLPLGVLRAILPVAQWVGTRRGSDVFTAASVGSLVSSPHVDHSKATRVLGYEPRPAQQTIADLTEWFAQNLPGPKRNV